MKKLLFFLLMLLFTESFSQISVQIKPSHHNYMLYDAVYLKVHLHNYSAMPIAFGQNEKIRGSLDFIVYRNGKTLVPKYKNTSMPLSGIILKPGEIRTVTLNLAKYCSLQEEGSYTVTAIVQHPKFTAKYQSNQVTFGVRQGSLYWSRIFGVPDYIGKQMGERQEPRQYNVRIFNNGKTQIYFLIVEDKDKVYAVKRLGFNLGPDYAPQLVVDGASRLHAMLNINHKVYIYYVYNYNGKLEKRQVYIKTTSTPFLVVNPANSSVIVDGGRVALKDVDYEEIKDLPFMDTIENPSSDSSEGEEGFGSFEPGK